MNPCKDCICFPVCYNRFEPNPFITISINKIAKHCEIVYDYITNLEPMRIHHNGLTTYGNSHQRDTIKEAEIYTYYTGYNK